MNDTNIVPVGSGATSQFDIRTFLTIGWRHRRLLVASFIAVLVGSVAYSLMNRSYESEMSFLVQRERIDPVVSSVEKPELRYSNDVTEEDLVSETQLMTSPGLLRKVVVLTGMYRHEDWWTRLRGHSEERQIAKKTVALQSKLSVDVPKKSNIFSVRYRADNPKQAALVLTTLSELYLEKHMQVHRPTGQYEFFQEQTERYRQQLAEAEKQLAEFPAKEGVVEGIAQRDLMVQKIADLQVTLQTAKAGVAETKSRIASLEEQMAGMPSRIVTAQKRADNPPLMQKLQGTLLDLQLQRAELLQKYQPTNRKVVEVEEKIAESKAAIDAALNSPMTEQTTDRDPTYDWLQTELAKARSELQSLQAQQVSTARSIAAFEANARLYNERGTEQQALVRTAKELEQSYQLYLRKQEEARITEALDRNKILNVAVAEEPTVPVLPVESNLLILLKSMMAACVVSTGLVLTKELMDPTFRTPGEVQRYLGVPVLAALPERLDG